MAGYRIAAIAAAAALWATPSWADSIDGSWCNEKTGKTFQISGPSIVTPGGARLEGAYSRHGFQYTVPPQETPAGAPVTMRLMGENVVQLQAGDAAQPELWRRCEQTS